MKTIDPNQEIAITATFKLLMDQSNDQQRDLAARLLLALLEGFELSRSENPNEDPADIAKRLHAGLDMRIRMGKDTGKEAHKIACTKGCAHCCHMRVGVLPVEAQLLYDMMQAKGLKIDQDRLTKQLRWPDDDDAWKGKPADERRCVFLGADNTCQVYEQRPLSCRKYFVISDPALCQIEKNPSARVGIWFDEQAEIIVSAAMTFFDVGTLPKMLLKAAQGKIRKEMS